MIISILHNAAGDQGMRKRAWATASIFQKEIELKIPNLSDQHKKTLASAIGNIVTQLKKKPETKDFFVPL
jgi:hypothetical protein